MTKIFSLLEAVEAKLAAILALASGTAAALDLHSLPPAEAAKFSAIFAGIAAVQRILPTVQSDTKVAETDVAAVPSVVNTVKLDAKKVEKVVAAYVGKGNPASEAPVVPVAPVPEPAPAPVEVPAPAPVETAEVAEPTVHPASAPAAL